MKRLLLAALLLPWLAAGQPATVASKPCLMDGTGCFSTAFSNLTGISASRLLGRGSAGGTGAAQEITLGTGLSMSGTTLSASGGGGSPGGSSGDLQWNDGGTLAGGGPTWDSVLSQLRFAAGYGILSSGYEFDHGPVSISESIYNTFIAIGSTQGGPGAGIRVGGPLHPGYLANMHVVGGGTYADNQTAGDVHIHGGQNWAAGTDSNAGSAYVYGGLGSGTGADGDVYLGTDGTTARGKIYLAAPLRKMSFDTAPSSASDTGTAGEIRITATYIYVCTATNTWVRAALATW